MDRITTPEKEKKLPKVVREKNLKKFLFEEIASFGKRENEE